ncbi:unnamed protein product [Cercospora beticola]|nr:unnamed protein product [Cercospora beticola]
MSVLAPAKYLSNECFLWYCTFHPNEWTRAAQIEYSDMNKHARAPAFRQLLIWLWPSDKKAGEQHGRTRSKEESTSVHLSRYIIISMLASCLAVIMTVRSHSPGAAVRCKLAT